jgi:hypothetical protein
MTASGPPRFDHIIGMTDARGTFEHAELTEPRREHGYCTDDMARVLVVAMREPRPSPDVQRLAALSLRFLRAAEGVEGGYRNRMNRYGHWVDHAGVADCWGRSVWALGTAVARLDRGPVWRQVVAQFERAARRRSPWPRAMAFAMVGAAELLAAIPDHAEACRLLSDGAQCIPGRGRATSWPWPEARLTYANAVLPEALIAAGAGLGRRRLVDDGLHLLGWLVDHETSGAHLSVTPAGGSERGSPRPAFDQQPIEVAAIADACARAATVDGDPRWARGVTAAEAWFLGDNDVGCVMWDAATGGAFDGLQASGPNLNQGTESGLALLATVQHARALSQVPS